MSVIRRIPAIFVGLAAVLVVSLPAQATLIGDEVNVAYEYRHSGGVSLGCGHARNVTVVANDSDSVGFCSNTLYVDVNAESIDLTYRDTFPVSPGDFNGVIVSDLDWVGAAGSIVGLNIKTDLVNWQDSFASFTTDSVSINFAEYANIGTGNLTSFDMRIGLVTTHGVPEPSTFALLGLGLLALGVSRRRRID